MDDRTEILYDHYKDTCALVRNKESSRNKLFLVCTAFLAILFLNIVEPDTKDLIAKYIQYTVHSDNSLNKAYIDLLIYFSFICCVLLYYSTCFFIQRQYRYIHKLEITIKMKINYDFSREIQAFTQKPSIYANIIYVLYTILFPLLVAALIMYKSMNDIMSKNENTMINLIIGVVGLIIITAYMIKEESRISLAAVKNADSL